jgi:hypothetical protein
MTTKEQILSELNAGRGKGHKFTEEYWHNAKLRMGSLLIQAKELGEDDYNYVADNFMGRGSARDFIGYRKAYDRLKKATVQLIRKYNAKKLKEGDVTDLKEIADKINDKVNAFIIVHPPFTDNIVDILRAEFVSEANLLDKANQTTSSEGRQS